MFRYIIVVAAAIVAASPVARAATLHTFGSPSDDRWHYPFNFNAGTAPFAKTFGTVGSRSPAGDRWFNERDGAAIFAWDTTTLIPAGQGAANYHVKSIKVILTSPSDATWQIDTTPDEWFTYDLNADGTVNADGIPRGQPGDTDGESDDVDVGRPFELFGGGFDPAGVFFNELTWIETSFFEGWNQQLTPVPRNPFPFVYQDGTLEKLHVEDNIAGFHNEALGVFEFTPTPWATGEPIGYTPGAMVAPFEVDFELDLGLSCGEVRRYFEDQLDKGRVIVIVTSLFETSQQPGDVIPMFYANTAAAGANLYPARIEIVLSDAAPGDMDADGDVDDVDLALFIAVLLDPAGATQQQRDRADLDGGGDPDGLDVAPFVNAYLGGC